MANKTTLSIDFLDVYGNRLKDKADITLRHTILMSANYRFQNRDATKKLTVTDVEFRQGGRYDLFIAGQKFSTVHQFVQVFEGKETNL
jgi:hypothetical protein